MSLPIQRIRPDLLLILVVYWGFSYPPIPGGLLAFSTGYVLDLFSGNAFGLYTFSRPLIFYFAHFFKGRFYLESPASQFLFVFTSVLFEGLIILILLTGLNPDPLGHLYPLFVSSLFPQSLVTGLIAPILFPFFRKGSSLLLSQKETGIKEKG